MAIVEMYYKPTCPFCKRAKQLLDFKNVTIDHYINIVEHPEKRIEMIRRAKGRKTVPQIFINDQHIGGSDDLFALDRKGDLDNLLEI